MKINFKVDANGWFLLELGKLCITGKGSHGKLFEFGWFCVYWNDETILDLE